ncbi:dTDP-4-dehydrorhamnose 3,5-epimerase [Mesorhizobium sp. CAU 1732]|uniref:dTDP-4-dehydrorhamnose 3,5-epimerase n=1 Tax=Mesorhizobium sp. CAU 1732 TaxID=3140358 RepID=UPI003260A259
MRFVEAGLDGAWLIEPEPVADERGSFARTFCTREFADHGLESNFVQHSVSHSVNRGTLRGLHFQHEPHAEVKVVSCIRGAILDVIVDMRPGSPTRRRWISVELTPQNRRQIYIPKGFAHGFITLDDDSVVSYLISEFYTPGAASGLRYDDPTLGIDWRETPTVISERDQGWTWLEASLA